MRHFNYWTCTRVSTAGLPLLIRSDGGIGRGKGPVRDPPSPAAMHERAGVPDLRAALAALASALRSIDKPAMLIGGLAVIARGVPRVTIDIDAVG